MLLLYLVIFVFILLYYGVFRYNTRKFRKFTKDAGKANLRSIPILGIAHRFIGNNTSHMKALLNIGTETNQAGGVAAAWFGPLPYVGKKNKDAILWSFFDGFFSTAAHTLPEPAIISDAATADVVLKECLDKGYLMKLLNIIMGDGLFFAPLSIWRKRRRVLVPTFSFNNLKKFVTIFSKQSHKMAELLEKNAGKEPFPIWNYLASNNMDSVCEAVFGVDMHIQESPKHPFLDSFNKGSSIMAARLCQPWLHSDLIFKLLPQYREVLRTRKALYDIIDEIISKKHKDIKDGKNNNKRQHIKPFLELLMESSADENSPYNDKELREETLTLTVAGTDTSAAGAAFALYALAKHQDVQDKVYQEIKDVIGDSTEELTADILKKLEYMDIAIREAMRLYTPVPVILRHTTHDVKLPSGWILPANCGIVMNIWALHRNQKYWGRDAEEFRPERFLDTPFKHPAQYMPFSYGPRGCPGDRYAMLSMKATLATLLRQFRVIHVDDELCLTFQLMMKDANDFRVRIERRN